jgi:hypothetical protein
MAGLATAQVVSQWFERVMVLERDRPEGNNDKTALDMAQEQQESRPGVAQVCRVQHCDAKINLWTSCCYKELLVPN